MKNGPAFLTKPLLGVQFEVLLMPECGRLSPCGHFRQGFRAKSLFVSYE
jgi:hypothetical protein